jgi:hypothetical protein
MLPCLLVSATLGEATQIEMILIAKVSKVAFHGTKLMTHSPTKFVHGNAAK